MIFNKYLPTVSTRIGMWKHELLVLYVSVEPVSIRFDGVDPTPAVGLYLYPGQIYKFNLDGDADVRVIEVFKPSICYVQLFNAGWNKNNNILIPVLGP